MAITREQLKVVSKIFPNMTVTEFLALTEGREHSCASNTTNSHVCETNSVNENKLHSVTKDDTGIYIDGFRVNGVEGFQIEKSMDSDNMNVIFKVAVKDLKYSTGGNKNEISY